MLGFRLGNLTGAQEDALDNSINPSAVNWFITRLNGKSTDSQPLWLYRDSIAGDSGNIVQFILGNKTSGHGRLTMSFTNSATPATIGQEGTYTLNGRDVADTAEVEIGGIRIKRENTADQAIVDLRAYTPGDGSIPRLRISGSEGYCGIGKSLSPLRRLHIADTSGFLCRFDRIGTDYYELKISSDVTSGYVSISNNLGNDVIKLRVTQNVDIVGTLLNISSTTNATARLKLQSIATGTNLIEFEDSVGIAGKVEYDHNIDSLKLTVNGVQTSEITNTGLLYHGLSTNALSAVFYRDTNAGDSTNNVSIDIGNKNAAQGQLRLQFENAVASGSPTTRVISNVRKNDDSANYEAAWMSFYKVAASDSAYIEFKAADSSGILGSRFLIYSDDGVAFSDSIPSWQSGKGIIFIKNATTVPTGNPSGGGFLYCEAGALKYRGSSGTITTLGNA